MGKIQILPPELINQIAAGEVVERPSSVVKELVENAIDAQATRLEIHANDSGRYLRVADNGCGMSAEDLKVAFCNHATSKVQKLDDLFQLNTLGFRGEALASIAAISKVVCLSRTQEATTGQKALVQSSGEVTLQETGCSVGTVFEIRDLFYNVPARLKFLKRPQTELSHIQEMVQLLALSHPEIAFQLKLEDAIALKTTGSGQLVKTIEEVFALNASESLLSFAFEDAEFGFKTWGQTSTPNVTRGSRKWVMTFVNGRAVRCPILGKAIESAYQSLMVPGKFPITVLFLELPPEAVDVNVHPTKKEVRYEQANTLFSFIRKAVENSLLKQSSQTSGVAEIKSAFASRAFPSTHESKFPEQQRTASHFQPSAVLSPRCVATERTLLEKNPTYHQAAFDMYQPGLAPGADISEEPYLPQATDYRIIGQLARTYILLENSEGLLIVDQHIASERVLFERFSEQAQLSQPVSQHLLLPFQFSLTAVQSASLAENKDAFEALGFRYELTEQAVHFHSVPTLYNDKVLQASLEGLLAHLEETGEVKLSFDDVIATAACHSAVRAGDVLNLEQMQRVITQWFACIRPWTCPHGRPVSHLLSHHELMQFFERPSLPAGI